MNQVIFTIDENINIAEATFKMTLDGDTSEILRPGQFVNFKLSGFYLRRPISVCDWDDKTLTVIYKVVGKGTEYMSRMKKGDTIDALCGLGNGYNPNPSGGRPVLIGGGAGVPPLYKLCKVLIAQEKTPSVILGFNTEEEVFYADEFKKLGADVYVATVDGSVGTKGFVTDILDKISYTYYFACGPEPMFKAIKKTAKTGGQLSFESRMGCGFGACMGCSCRTLTGNKRICKEGPVMRAEDVIWE